MRRPHTQTHTSHFSKEFRSSVISLYMYHEKTFYFIHSTPRDYVVPITLCKVYGLDFLNFSTEKREHIYTVWVAIIPDCINDHL